MAFSGISDRPDPDIILWSITTDASRRSDKLVDKFGYKPGQNVLYVAEAWNDDDGTPNRLKLRDIAVGWLAPSFPKIKQLGGHSGAARARFWSLEGSWVVCLRG